MLFFDDIVALVSFDVWSSFSSKVSSIGLIGSVWSLKEEENLVASSN